MAWGLGALLNLHVRTYERMCMIMWLWALLNRRASPYTYRKQIARQVGGEWLADWIVLSAALSNVGLYLVGGFLSLFYDDRTSTKPSDPVALFTPPKHHT